MNDEIFAKLHKSAEAVDRLQDALNLPFRPVPLQPIADIKRYVNQLMGQIKQLEEKNARLEDENDRLKLELDNAAQQCLLI